MKSVEDVFKSVSSSPAGLSSDEVVRRLRAYGFNEIVEKRENPIKDFVMRLWNPMAWLLEIAIILSILIGHYIEGSIILSLLLINAFIGFRHSRTSMRALELLKSKLQLQVKVLRDGSWRIVPGREIVPGDVVLLELGDIVPADGVLFEGFLEVDESMLTGESLPIEKGVGDKLYAGSIVRQGRGKVVITATGSKTYFGRTAELVKIARPRSHQQEIMMNITKYMMILGGIVVAISMLYALAIGITRDIIALAILSISILMGAVPVALPAVLSIMQAIAAIDLAKRGVLVTRLDAIEDASTVTVMCMDKTGTITTNNLTIVDVRGFNDIDRDEVLRLAYMATAEASQNPIDRVIRSYVESNGLRPSYELIEYKPFTPETKRSEAYVKYSGKELRIVLGAPQVIASITADSSDTKNEYLNLLKEFSEKGYRSLGVAIGNSSLRIAGLIAIIDPPRRESAELIKRLKDLGLKIIMITGDNKLIAREIARLVGIGEKVYSMSEVRKDGEISEEIIYADAIAEVLPEDKYRIVKKLQEKGHRVGMTGDGVNDAPALKQAELGIAVSNATDVAKSAASIVLTIPGLTGIVDIVNTSRIVYQRALTWMINKVVKTIQFSLLAAITFLLMQQNVITLLGMTLLIFANDFATISLATDNSIPTTKPGRLNIRNIVIASGVIGIWLVIAGVLALYIGRYIFNYSIKELQTFMLLILVYSSQFRILIIRERREFYRSRPGRELLLSTISMIIIFTILGTLGIVIKPIPITGVLLSLAYSALTVFAIDPLKVYIFKLYNIGL